MATADKLKKYVTDIANAIRAKEGSTEKINPQDFVQRIDNLQVGGGTSESDWHYFDVSNDNTQAQMTIMQYASVVKGSVADLGGMSILPLGLGLVIPNAFNGTTAIAIDYSIEMVTVGQKSTIGQVLPTAPWFENFTEITKEQFYTLE